MPIVSSTVKVDRRPANGRGMVVCEHVWDDGQIEPAVFEAHSSEDANSRLAAQISAREAGRVRAEINSNVNQVMANGSLAVIVIHASTNAQNLAALREAYQSATKIEAIMIGDFLSSLTDANLRNIFSMTQTQLNNLRSNKLAPAATAATTIRATVGA